MKMIRKKHGLRIATFLAILMFLLMPFMSQPVAADLYFYIGSMESTTPPPDADYKTSSWLSNTRCFS